MKSFEFYKNLANENNGQINVIMRDPDGFRVMTINGRSETSEMNGKSYKYYSEFEKAIQSSQIKQHASFKLFYIIQNGSDFNDAIAVEI